MYEASHVPQSLKVDNTISGHVYEDGPLWFYNDVYLCYRCKLNTVFRYLILKYHVLVCIFASVRGNNDLKSENNSLFVSPPPVWSLPPGMNKSSVIDLLGQKYLGNLNIKHIPLLFSRPKAFLSISRFLPPE